MLNLKELQDKKEKYLEKRLNELTAKEAPKRLVREANGDFSRPPRPPKH